MSNRTFHRTEIKIVVLSEEPLPSDDLTLSEIAHGIAEGDWSGEWEIVETQPLTGPQAAKALTAQGSEPGFFQLDDDGNDTDAEDDEPTPRRLHILARHGRYYSNAAEGGVWVDTQDIARRFDLSNAAEAHEAEGIIAEWGGRLFPVEGE